MGACDIPQQILPLAYKRYLRYRLDENRLNRQSRAQEKQRHQVWLLTLD